MPDVLENNQHAAAGQHGSERICSEPHTHSSTCCGLELAIPADDGQRQQQDHLDPLDGARVRVVNVGR